MDKRKKWLLAGCIVVTGVTAVLWLKGYFEVKEPIRVLERNPPGMGDKEIQMEFQTESNVIAPSRNSLCFGAYPLFFCQCSCIGAGKTDSILLICDLCTEPADHEQLFITSITLDQSTLNAAFQYSDNKQTEYNSHISRQKFQPRNTEIIKNTIDQRYYSRGERQHQNSPAVWNTAFDQHDSKSCYSTKYHPSYYQKIA